MFFVVDVETSGLTPWTGELLSVGIVPVTEFGEIEPDIENHFYSRVVYQGANIHYISEENMTPTQKWWLEQDYVVRDEAWNGYPRTHLYKLRNAINEYVERIEPDKSKRFIAANPVAFDKMWLESVYAQEYNKLWPFHYRCLCLRSMRYGLEFEETEYGSAKGAQESQVPHHAYHDALAEAYDLKHLIELKERYIEEILSR